MSNHSSIYRTREGETRYLATYAATLELWPVSFETLYVPTRTGSAHIIACGAEDLPPLILLPMASMSATMWFPNVADLSQHYRIYAVDTLNDLGKSLAAHPSRSRSDSAGWLLDMLDGLSIDKAYLVGASYGGWLTFNLAIAAPDRIWSMVLLAPAGTFKPLGWKFFASMLPAALLPFKPIVRFFTRPMASRSFKWPDRLVNQITAGLRYRSKLHIADMALCLPFSDDELRQMHIPTLLFYGSHEIICNPHAALNRAMRFIPNIEAELVPGVGHGLSMEKPAFVNERIIRFFTAPIHSDRPSQDMSGAQS